MVKVGKFQRITQEEDRRVVAHQIPVSFLRIELQGKTTDVALGVGGTTLAGYRRDAGEEVCLLADRGENFGAGVLGDVVRDRKRPVGTGTFGMHPSFGDDFTIKMGEFFQEPDVLQQLWTPWPGSQDVLIVGDRTTRVGSEGFFLGHDQTPAQNAGEVACGFHYCKK